VTWVLLKQKKRETQGEEERPGEAEEEA
jgi:hypothetical protein